MIARETGREAFLYAKGAIPALTGIAPFVMRRGRNESIADRGRFAFQSIRPVVSREKCIFSAYCWPGGAGLPPRAFCLLQKQDILWTATPG